MNFLGKEISGRYTIPSGIITTDAKVIERIANEIPEIGVITTKSICLEPRDGYREPILHQHAPGCFVNAVGLTNPGARAFAGSLSMIRLPKDKFLLCSIFGKNKEEFVAVAKILEPYCDGFELNLSCPHAKGYGMAIGQDPSQVEDITRAVKQATDLPVIPKLTPNVDDITVIAQAAERGGADAISAINTVGPIEHRHDDHPVLTNIKGGKSGKDIFDLVLDSIKKISQSTDIPLIACGRISCAQDAMKMEEAGATIIGIGSALAGMKTEDLKVFFRSIADGKDHNMEKVSTEYKKFTLKKNIKHAQDLSVLCFEETLPIKPGQFIFAWIPGVGEKPFSVLDNEPLTLAIQGRGCFTRKIITLDPGTEVYIRGPYGNPVKSTRKTILVGGGCGLAALYMIAKENRDCEIFIGAKDKEHLFYLDETKKICDLHVATEDGSLGYKGFITDLLQKRLKEMCKDESIIFYNCGPERMIKAAIEIEREFTLKTNIFSSIDHSTKCGIGLCGSCATKSGERLCVDGPFFKK
ncbi:dihydroorotate dehydrogenase [Candidatus Woesearchaeota archaeon CG11_big_fil_rev_8_21_14_0_20_43_8]|nr:MAG: dihydroorotate dehydrogenase [Candidatus Woesearchaeota archaeon CG11_big_fil_rev_8_21_14_0_20_43_8]PIO06137.1 MAG: dihydroorotate dehydrogenase [Candidatus Woesearchaeota archaeon CG08_land_8_20_14_0_20_43_7]